MKADDAQASVNRDAGGEQLLVVEGLSIAFGGVRAVSGVSMSVPRGSVVSVIGPNGAGKTTLFNCVTGVYRADTGHVRLNGQELVGLRPHRIAELGVARTFQNIELFARMTVLENILLGRHRHMRTGPFSAMLFGRRVKEHEAEQRRRAEEILEFLGPRGGVIGPLVHNRLLEPARRMSSWIDRVLDRLSAEHCPAIGMSGSGTSCFAVCRSAGHARRVAARLRCGELEIGSIWAVSSV